jgi:hypothetical protein
MENTQASQINSHLINLTFNTHGIRKENYPPDRLQIVCRKIYNGQGEIVGQTEILETGGRTDLHFTKSLETEYVFQRKQALELEIIYDGKFTTKVSFFLGQLIGERSNRLELRLSPQGGYEGTINVHYTGTQSLETSRCQLDEDREMFFDYLSNELNISVIACVDFTISNGSYN